MTELLLPDPDSSLLFPRPQRLREQGGHMPLTAVVHLEAPLDLDTSDMPAVAWLALALEAREHRLERGSGVGASTRLLLQPLHAARRAPATSAAALQGYTLSVGGGVISIGYPSPAGLAYAFATLAQLVTLAEGAPGGIQLPQLDIEDWPDFAQRGVMLDISRDKVPTLGTLRALIDRLAHWKINQLQLYMEHTFAYAGHEVVWKGAGALTAAEVRELDAYCAARHIELVPNQNSFGHMHRWLVHEPYRALAECPDGFAHPWNWSGEPYGLCATDPASLRFLEGLYDQLLPNFTSQRFNVGLDETIDLGHGRSRAACTARGTERVYLEFLKEVQARVQARGKVMQFWGDIIVKRPDLLAELPPNAVALEWGYEADHPFAEHLALFARAGLEFQVCPGTSSWNSIAGRTDNAIENIARAAREGKAAGASGLLVTDWGDHGHLQPLSVSYLGLFAAAGFSWNVADAQRPAALELPRRLDRHVFFDSASVLGRVAFDLGNAYQHAGSLRPNASVLFWILLKPERLFNPPGVTPESLARTLDYLERVGAALPLARPGTLGLAAAESPASQAMAGDGQLVVAELGWARDLLCFACRLGIALGSLPDRRPEALSPALIRAPVRQALGRELRELIERQRGVWLARNREGGLDDSLRPLWKLLDALEIERR